MNKCQVCGYDNPAEANTCLNCGSPIERQSAAGPADDDLSGEATVMLGIPTRSGIKPPAIPGSPAQPPSSAPGSSPSRSPVPPPPPPPAAVRHSVSSSSAPPPPPPPGMMPQRPAAPPASQFSASPAAASPAPPSGEGPNATVYIVLSVAEILCCCMPAGAIGLVFSILGMNAAKAGDYVLAAKNFKNAKLTLIIGAILGAIVGILWFLGSFIGALAQN